MKWLLLVVLIIGIVYLCVLEFFESPPQDHDPDVAA